MGNFALAQPYFSCRDVELKMLFHSTPRTKNITTNSILIADASVHVDYFLNMPYSNRDL